MSTLDKFKNQKTAYLLKITAYMPEYENISEVDIVSVGRKYVTIANDVKFAESERERDYLVEQVNCGWSSYLFTTKQDALNYVEKRQLVTWLAKFTRHFNDVSLDGLRRIKSIIENDLKTKKKETVKTKNSDFWDMYRMGDIVFPPAVQRYFMVTKQAAIEICEKQVHDGKCVAVYFVKCPKCQKLGRKYYSREDVPAYYTCENCCEECEDIPVSDDMIVKYYEWLQ